MTYNPLGEEYKTGDEPAMMSVKLTVEKKTAFINHVLSDKKQYDGNPIDEPACTTNSDEAFAFEYKLFDADDSECTLTASKNVGIYTIRISTPETDIYKAASSTMTFEITPKEVTISEVTVSGKIYDGNTYAEITSDGGIRNCRTMRFTR